MRRIPVIPTIVVLLAAAAMVWLGLWQLQRRTEKEALLAAVAANPASPPLPFPHVADDRLLFRRSYADCAPPVTVTRAGAGNAGFRLIAHCAGGALVQLGTTRDPMATRTFAGGPVTGWISHAPDQRPLIARAWDHTPTPLLLVSDRPLAAGLAANTPPDAGLIPNNHLAYAVQWFVFAALALGIYAIALIRRR